MVAKKLIAWDNYDILNKYGLCKSASAILSGSQQVNPFTAELWRHKMPDRWIN